MHLSVILEKLYHLYKKLNTKKLSNEKLNFPFGKSTKGGIFYSNYA
jgi:hypothetical protein